MSFFIVGVFFALLPASSTQPAPRFAVELAQPGEEAERRALLNVFGAFIWRLARGHDLCCYCALSLRAEWGREVCNAGIISRVVALEVKNVWKASEII